MGIKSNNIEKEDVALQSRQNLGHPSMFRVIMLNDDYTPMAFVVKILQSVFEKKIDDATKIMLDIHKSGMGVCGVYTYEVAETKIALVMELAKRENYPLQCEMEKA